MIHILRWACIALGIWMIRQAFRPPLHYYRYRRPDNGPITRETY